MHTNIGSQIQRTRNQMLFAVLVVEDLDDEEGSSSRAEDESVDVI
jgi:hypothetical protein